MRVVDELPSIHELGVLLRDDKQGPLVLRENDRDVAVIVSPEEYRHFAAYRFNQLCEKIGAEAQANGLTEEILNEILAEAKAERRR